MEKDLENRQLCGLISWRPGVGLVPVPRVACKPLCNLASWRLDVAVVLYWRRGCW